ncbi:hypothetical protein H6P81_020807 [Aristolochia fimbriata]|uniref:Uncharacterized protein n=1 Tax=Aristolochia fimbriata TaxID=158543 RepID=A0AAV7DYL7_ARIFI|nr:hypothetical protein H6P81_020807 [Aristolochia fimbriata]
MAHRVHSLGKVPFSWENAPGVCKSSTRGEEEYPEFVYEEQSLKLPPPPCPSESPRVSVHHDLHIPLPPCPFQPLTQRSCSRKGLKREDPFLAAYMECTKKGEQGKSSSCQKSNGVRGKMNLLSCKLSCGVRDDSLVKVVHRSCSRVASHAKK